MGSIPAGNDPFIGGSKTPNAPPPALGGSIAPAQTNVSNPIAGVNPGAPFFARNNRGSNIGIPYARYTSPPVRLLWVCLAINLSTCSAGSAPSVASAT